MPIKDSSSSEKIVADFVFKDSKDEVFCVEYDPSDKYIAYG